VRKNFYLQCLVNVSFFYDRELDLSHESNSEVPFALQVASNRLADSLVKLDLSWCPKLSKAVFEKALDALGNTLRILSLAHSKSVDDRFAACMADKAPHLEELDVSYTCVGSQGAKRLAEGCQKLLSLKVEHTSVDDDAASDVLFALRRLVAFDYQDSVTCVFNVLNEDPARVFNLISLSSGVVNINDDILHACLRATPRVRKLHLSMYESMSGVSLHPLGDISSELAEFHMTNTDGLVAAPAAIVLAPVLARHGESLLSLTLVEVREVCIGDILSACPNLLHLSLQYNPIYLRSPKRDFKSQLRTLTVLSVASPLPEYDILPGATFTPPGDDLHAMLSSPHLSSLTLANCAELTDVVFSEARVVAEDFPCLLDFELDSCHELTIKPLLSFLTGVNKLRLIKLLSCRDIHLKDYEQCCKLLKKKKLGNHVSIIWR